MNIARPARHLLLLLGCWFFAPLSAMAQDSIPPHQTIIITSQKLSETRVINVWTPLQYTDTGYSLPVLYMPDGGIREDFPHMAQTLSKLVATGKIPPMILVGIENTQRRRDLTGPTAVKSDKKIAPSVGEAEAFRAFIHDELFPEIARKYRITSQRSIIGESLAGLFVIETFLLHPDMFDNYIAMDPSLWWNNQYLIKHAKELLADLPDAPKKLWFAGSNAADISQATLQLDSILQTANLSHLKWHYASEPGEQHQTIFRATKEKALLWTFQ